MKLTKSNMTTDLFEKAQQLYEVEATIKQAQDELKTRLAPMEAEAEALRTEVLQLMHDARLKSVRVEDGSSYQRVYKAKFEITDPEAAERWAKRNGCMRLDKTEANKILLRLPKVPKGFEQNDVEHLRITKANV